MAMRFRYLRLHAKEAVGVYRCVHFLVVVLEYIVTTSCFSPLSSLPRKHGLLLLGNSFLDTIVVIPYKC